jgi:HAD superfamily hydrolase (TIGR01549 family)
MALELKDIRWLFFDIGYTLINEDGAAIDRLNQAVSALAVRGIHISTEALSRAFQEAAAEYHPSPFVRALQRFTDDPDVHAFVQQSGKYRKELEEPYPEACALLSALVSRYSLGIIANQPAGTLERLEVYGMTPYISVCLSSTEVGLRKPDPAIFKLALEQAGCEPHHAVMIGDRIDNDIKPARALGLKTVRVLQGPARMQQPRSAGEEADATVSNLKELMEIL